MPEFLSREGEIFDGDRLKMRMAFVFLRRTSWPRLRKDRFSRAVICKHDSTR
jgi:hypothetical protein